MPRFFTIVLVVLLNLSFQEASAARRYVSDELVIPLRTGPSVRNKIIGYLRSGDTVRTIEESGEYVRVKAKTKKDYDGWVKSRFLHAEPIAKIRLESFKADLEKVETMKAELAEYRKIAKDATAGQEKSAKELARIKQISSNVVQLDDNNRQLKQDVERLEAELKLVREQNIVLGQNQRNEGIKLGILAIALGALVGFILPYMKPRQGRRQSSVRLR